MKNLACLAFVLCLGAPVPLLGFMQDIPENLKDRPDEQLRWLNTEFEQAYTLQLKVAVQRHEERMERRDYALQSIADQAFAREQLIAEAEQVTREELESVARQSNAALGGLVAIIVLMTLAVWWVRGRTVEVESRTSVSDAGAQARSDVQDVLESLAKQRSTRLKSPKNNSSQNK